MAKPPIRLALDMDGDGVLTPGDTRAAARVRGRSRFARLPKLYRGQGVAKAHPAEGKR